MIISGKKYLITLENWFVAPDGEEYKALWGEAHSYSPVSPDTEWVVNVGSGECYATVPRNKIISAIRCDEKPKDKFRGKTYPSEEKFGINETASRIYLFGEENES